METTFKHKTNCDRLIQLQLKCQLYVTRLMIKVVLSLSKFHYLEIEMTVSNKIAIKM